MNVKLLGMFFGRKIFFEQIDGLNDDVVINSFNEMMSFEQKRCNTTSLWVKIKNLFQFYDR